MKVDMRPEAVESRLRKQGRLTKLCLSLAGPRRRPVSSFGPLTPLDENGNPCGEPIVLRETPPGYRAEVPKT